LVLRAANKATPTMAAAPAKSQLLEEPEIAMSAPKLSRAGL